jgi:hypothetical protein
VAVVAADDEEGARPPLGSFYVDDGAHKSLALAKRLVAAKTKYHPVEARHLAPRRQLLAGRGWRPLGRERGAAAVQMIEMPRGQRQP